MAPRATSPARLSAQPHEADFELAAILTQMVDQLARIGGNVAIEQQHALLLETFDFRLETIPV